MFENCTLLITGGTGSFGNAVLEKFLNTEIEEIRIFSRDEKKQTDMRIKYNNEKVNFIIGDVRNYESIYNATKGVDYIFHAAALKQVPVCEFNPMEAVRTNVLGTYNTLNAAIENKVKKVIVLSTDKAVYPVSAMGQTKALMEKLTIAKARSQGNKNPIFCCTRYGNLIKSRGSVIPLFVHQVKTGQPITITDPQMTRFLRSLEEAVNLVLYAFQNGEQGDTFVHKAPAVTMLDLALAVQEIFNPKAEIKNIGMRHGEKLHEAFVTQEEMARSEETEHYYRIKADVRDLNYSKVQDEKLMLASHYKACDSENARRLTVDEIKELLLSLDIVKNALESQGEEGI